MSRRLSLLLTAIRSIRTATNLSVRLAVHRFLLATLVFGLVGSYSNTYADSTDNDGIFLVATEQLQGSSFEQAVILLTHYSDRGATGLTINRPTRISLKQAFPRIQQLRQRTERLYLGGPVSTSAIFVLLRTLQPNNTMHRIAGDIYFSTGENAFSRPQKSAALIARRTYAGYVGWTPGQLQNEISRGDWLMVHTHPAIIFEENTESLWHRLTKRWKGKWI